jgi:hypothetical protein
VGLQIPPTSLLYIVYPKERGYRGGWFTTEQGNSQTQEDLTDLSNRLDKILQI